MRSIIRDILAVGLVAAAIPAATAIPTAHGRDGLSSRIRTVITTDMEQDDLASLLRYLLYTNELDTQGLIYSTSKFHWAGDGNGTEFFLPDREYDTPQTEWRWTGTRYIEDIVLEAYAEVYPNLRTHDPMYPTPEELLSIVRIGNIIFEGEMDADSAGSDLIRSLLLDDDPRPLYLQAWGGVSTIARALRSIEKSFSCSKEWPQIKEAVSQKAIIMASGFQDERYTDFIAPRWPNIQVRNFAAAYHPWSYHCAGTGIRGLPEDQVYFSGEWTKANIQIGPYGSLYRSWLDGQFMPGDPLDIFGIPELASDGWCKPLDEYDFLSEGDNVCFNALIITGLEDPAEPTVGGWGGRLIQNSTSPDLWELVDTEKHRNGTELQYYTNNRWVAAQQNDWAARMQWTMTSKYEDGNHTPSVKILNGKKVEAHAGSTVKLTSLVSDPDGDNVETKWWQYLEEGTYPEFINMAKHGDEGWVEVPTDAEAGQTISIILEGTDDGQFPITRYDRIMILVI